MEKIASNGEIPFFNLLESLSDNSRDQVLKCGTLKVLDRNEAAYTAGQEADSFFIVKSGRIKLFLHDTDGKEVLKALIHTGEIFGEAAIFHSGSRHEYAAAMDDRTEILEISAADAARFMREMPDFSFRITMQIAEKLCTAERRIQALTFQNSRTRIIEFLKESARKQGRKVGFETLLRPFLTHQDIGSLTTTSRQTVSSVLNELKGSNKIYYDRHRLLIRDISGL